MIDDKAKDEETPKTQINFGAQLRDIEDKPMTEKYVDDEGETEDRDVTLRLVCVSALRAGGGKDKLSAEEHMNRHLMACNIHQNDYYDMTVEEIAKLKKLVAGAGFTTSVAGPALVALDPVHKKKLEKSSA